MTSPETLKLEAGRAGVSVGEYEERLERGELWCEACPGWHLYLAFPADGRRHTGRATACYAAIRAEAREAARGVAAGRDDSELVVRGVPRG
jgi:hypothetical protein